LAGNNTADKYKAEYGRDAHIWRTFNPFHVANPDMNAFIKNGGIAFLTPQIHAWTTFNGSDELANQKIVSWAKVLASVKPHQVMFAPGFEPDGHVHNGTNMPTAYIAAWSNIHAIFRNNSATNVLMVMDYSGKIKMGGEYLIKELWPGDHLVDWIFFNIFSHGGPGNYVAEVNKSYGHLLELTGPGYNFTSKPWGLGAFSITDTTVNPTTNRPRWLVDAKGALGTRMFPRLKAYVYYGPSWLPDYMKPAYKSFITDPFFDCNDKNTTDFSPFVV